MRDIRKKRRPAIALLLGTLALAAGCRDSQFGGGQVTLSPANPIPRLYEVRFVRVWEDGDVDLQVHGRQRRYAVGDKISTSAGEMRILDTNPKTHEVVLKKL
jgi:hypothetical protein